jgi:hypothetical protein
VIRVHVFDVRGRFGTGRMALESLLYDAVAHVRARSRLRNVDLVVQPLDGTTGSYPIIGKTFDGNNVHIAVDPSFLDEEDGEAELSRTCVHELHHALRWRHVRRWTVAEAVVLEGLALVADHDAAGPAGVFADRALRDPNGALDYLARNSEAPAALHDRWLYSSEPEHPGDASRVYKAGKLVVGAALQALDETAWDAVRRPGIELVREGMAALGRPMHIEGPASAPRRPVRRRAVGA